MKRLIRITLAMSALACAHAQETAAQWADKNAKALQDAAGAPALAALVKQGRPAYDALFARIQTGGEADPVASVTVAALTQHVMAKDAPKAARKAYADALLAAAQNAKEPNVACFFLDQLRWCGLPGQAKAIAALATSADAGVAELAKITLYAVTDDRAAKLKPSDPSACRRFNQEMAKLSAGARSKRLTEAFDGADNGVAGAALAWLNEKGNVEKTAAWAAKLATVADPTRRIMLIDALAARGDTSAVPAIEAAACQTDSPPVAKAALAALIRLDAAAFVARLTDTLKTVTPQQAPLWRDAARQVATGLLVKPLLADYAAFNGAGQKLALDLFRERRAAEAVPLAQAAAASDDADTAIAGYRVLRDVASANEAEAILTRLPKTPARAASEAQGAFAAIARRDTGGACTEMLRKAAQAADGQGRTIFYETAARMGGDTLLDDIEKTAAGADAELAAGAIRALCAWADARTVPTLMRLALTAADAKNQTLALRGATQKLSAKDTDKAAFREQWQKIRDTLPDGENKKTIDEALQ